MRPGRADYGIAGGKGKGLIFKKGRVLGTYPYEELCERLVELIEKDGSGHERAHSLSHHLPRL